MVTPGAASASASPIVTVKTLRTGDHRDPVGHRRACQPGGSRVLLGLRDRRDGEQRSTQERDRTDAENPQPRTGPPSHD
jgi:hypothetical protein